MLDDSIRILNFDDSIVRQQKLISSYNTQILDLKDAGPKARIWLDNKTKSYIQEYIRGSSRASITFLGSGDFHHISSLLIEQFDEPISVIIFDYHPDWDILPPKFGCGSWVNRVLEKNNVMKVISLGVASSDISSFWIQTANLDSLSSDRVEIYPYSHAPTKILLRKVPQNISVRLRQAPLSGIIDWRQLKGNNLADFLSQIIKRLPTKQVYVSIDKDCLRREYSLTNWEEGNLQLEDLLTMLGLIKEKLDIVGLDISGDYSDVRVCGKIKNIVSRFDHPRIYSAKGVEAALIDSVNEQTNIKIIELLKS